MRKSYSSVVLVSAMLVVRANGVGWRFVLRTGHYRGRIKAQILIALEICTSTNVAFLP